MPEWERVLTAAARLQKILPETVLVGGTESAIYAQHRLSEDADHIMIDLKSRFDHVLAQLESVAGWRTARVNRPVLILGSLDGIETGVRQLIRDAPLETETIDILGQSIVVPTRAEMLRIKGVLIVKRNATRDYLDFAALAHHVGIEAVAQALQNFDKLYQQPNAESSLQQLQAQLSHPTPFDLDETDLSEYKNLIAEWQNWDSVRNTCARIAVESFSRIIELQSAENYQRDR